MLISLSGLDTHPLRAGLHSEVRARPPESMAPPLFITHLVMASDASEREASRAHVADLLLEHGLAAPDPKATHLRADLPSFRLGWELHTEFVTWTLSCSQTARCPDGVPRCAAGDVPQQWLAGIPGRCLAATQMRVLPRGGLPAEAVRRSLHEDALVGSVVAGGCAEVYTVFSLLHDGFSRTCVLASDVPRRALGRLVQQLLEIETYCMAALLGLPEAREASIVLGDMESELAALAHSIRAAGTDEEPQLLDQLRKLAGQVESEHAATHSRLSASAAYFELVDRRVVDIGESRIAGLQTIGEFLNSRLSPARATCAWASRRQEALSRRNRAAAKQQGPSGRHEQPPGNAATAAIHRRRPVGCRNHVLHRQPARLCREGRQRCGLDAEAGGCIGRCHSLRGSRGLVVVAAPAPSGDAALDIMVAAACQAGRSNDRSCSEPAAAQGRFRPANSANRLPETGH